jgi:site-specific DNA recombinase
MRRVENVSFYFLLKLIEVRQGRLLEVFAKTLKAKLLAKDSAFAKSYLNPLVDEIVVTDKTANIKGSYGTLAHAVAIDKIKVSHLKQVPTSISDWCARRDSNS